MRNPVWEIAQVLSPIFEQQFSDNSFGFRPKLKQYIRGWVNYFKIADLKSLLKEVDEWMRRRIRMTLWRIRMTLWKQWKKVKTKFERLPKLGLDKQKAWEFKLFSC